MTETFNTRQSFGKTLKPGPVKIVTASCAFIKVGY